MMAGSAFVIAAMASPTPNGCMVMRVDNRGSRAWQGLLGRRPN